MQSAGIDATGCVLQLQGCCGEIWWLVSFGVHMNVHKEFSSRIPHCKSSVVHFNFSGFNVVVDRCSTWRCDGQSTIGSLLPWINTLTHRHPPDNSQQPAVCCWTHGPCQWCFVHNMNSGSLKACHHLVSWKHSNLGFENILFFPVCKRGKIPMHPSSELKAKRRLFCPVVSHCTENHLIRIN